MSRRRKWSSVSKATKKLNKTRNEKQPLTRDWGEWEVKKQLFYVYLYFKKFS